ncbi:MULTISPECIES: exonuclease domain-containing protein [unclassified Cellulophaga]|uniref:exonuclease domain-containing protein n=1 Tax=unclassified Cellulophaga TaxID=2634405 RepID=UPI0026E3DCAA|nr:MULTISPECIES: exonuclease domain-containing protein [unclassified Cellulophaga]MDO6490886.1 exonuclease domain-containing protein [Cellulophaga sp. 2_MG-2023]MDO6493920.1 exonuclease domain-containing protein [Cellulophaga sp. 3_MG-2023]
MMYTIIDVETTGQTNRITEISIFKFDGKKVVDEFTSLVNPESVIPYYITTLTGIDNAMVANAPTFAEIAQQVLDITEDTIFVAHNVNFDYNVIRNEFKAIDKDFRRKKLCTIRLSRKLIPGHKSYSLGKISKDLNITIEGRHRARGDAEATVTLFKILLAQDDAETVFNSFLKKTSKEGALPSHLPTEVFNKIPNTPGIYYFKNKKGKIIYIGKAIDLKKRVLSHFYSKTQKSLDMCRETTDIDFELSGSELLALLMEDAAIKQHYPEYNQLAKRNLKNYAVFSYTDRKGIMHLAYNTLKSSPNPLKIFSNIRQCRAYVEELCFLFNLCPKYCHLQEGVAACNHHKISSCNGICRDNEAPEAYNQRVNLAIQHIKDVAELTILKEKGRTEEEEAFVLLKNGTYMGYGFIDKTETIKNNEDIENYLIPQKDNLDIQKILRGIKKQKLV